METKQLTIKTDNKWKHFKYRYEVPSKVLQEQFDHLEEEEALDGFILYRKFWYHLSDFISLNNPFHGCPSSPLCKSWDGMHTDSTFSGVLIKVSKDCEEYKIGTALS